MKRVSKRPTIQKIHKHTFSKTSSFQEAQIVNQGGHFVKPSSHASFSHPQLQIICKGYGLHAQVIANQVLQYIKQPMLTLINPQSKINKCSDELLGTDLTQQSKHRYFVLNLLDSCFQQLSNKNYDGSCSFGLSYIFNNTLFIVKNKTIECYIMNKRQRDQYEFKTLASRKLPFVLNTISNGINKDQILQKQTTGFLYSDRNYQNIIAKKFFPQVSFISMKIPKTQNIIFIMGNSQTLCNFNEKQLIQIYQQNKNLRSFGQQVINKSKQKWKTIYQQDMTMIVSKLF